MKLVFIIFGFNGGMEMRDIRITESEIRIGSIYLSVIALIKRDQENKLSQLEPI